MDHSCLRNLLESFKQNEITMDDTLDALTDFYFEDIGHALVDHHRSLRSSMPEVIFGLGKTPEQVADIARALHDKGSKVLVTRTGEEQFSAVKSVIPTAVFHRLPCMITSEEIQLHEGDQASAAVITAGTGDISVAEEAAITLEFFGTTVTRIFDVGVAGLHRLANKIEIIRKCRVAVVAAGMDGALPGVIAGMVDIPVIGLPTSVGYGAGANGLAPLLTMLNSCAPGVGVVNIDNGFGAAALAGAIIRSGRRWVSE